MAQIIEEKIYTIFFNNEELNKLNEGKPFEITFNENRITIKRSGITYKEE